MFSQGLMSTRRHVENGWCSTCSSGTQVGPAWAEPTELTRRVLHAIAEGYLEMKVTPPLPSPPLPLSFTANGA